MRANEVTKGNHKRWGQLGLFSWRSGSWYHTIGTG